MGAALENYPSQKSLNIMAQFGIYGTSKSVGSVVFTGAGLNDMTNGGVYTGTEDKNYVVEIDGTGTPDTFKWSDDGGETYTEGVAITGAAQALSNGITVTFQATTGHTLGDKWEFTALAFDTGVSSKPSVNIMSEASIAATGDAESTVLDMRNLRKLALSIACTFHASATAGITVEILTSYDGVNWDTEAWASSGLAPALSAGNAVQKTSNIDGLPAFMKVKVTNNDTGQAVTLVEVNVTKVE